MPFVSIFEQQIIDRQLEVLNLEKQSQEYDERILQGEKQVRAAWFQSIGVCLRVKFQTAGTELFAEVQKQTDLDWLRRFLASIETAASLEELRRLLP